MPHRLRLQTGELSRPSGAEAPLFLASSGAAEEAAEKVFPDRHIPQRLEAASDSA
jgi:hypothetical protein